MKQLKKNKKKNTQKKNKDGFKIFQKYTKVFLDPFCKTFTRCSSKYGN